MKKADALRYLVTGAFTAFVLVTLDMKEIRLIPLVILAALTGFLWRAEKQEPYEEP